MGNLWPPNYYTKEEIEAMSPLEVLLLEPKEYISISILKELYARDNGIYNLLIGVNPLLVKPNVTKSK